MKKTLNASVEISGCEITENTGSNHYSESVLCGSCIKCDKRQTGPQDLKMVKSSARDDYIRNFGIIFVSYFQMYDE